MDKVLTVCHQEFSNYPEHYRISRQDGTQVYPSDWRLFHTEAEGSFINISVQMLTSEAPDARDLPPDLSWPDDQSSRSRATRSERDSIRSSHSQIFSDVSDVDQNSTRLEVLRSSDIVEGDRDKRRESSGRGSESGFGPIELEDENHQSTRSIVNPLEQSLHASGIAQDLTSEGELQESDGGVRNKPGRAMVDAANDFRQGERSREERPPPILAPDAGSTHMGALVKEPERLPQPERSLALIRYERRNTARLRPSRTNSIGANIAYASESPAFHGNLEIHDRFLPSIDPWRAPGLIPSIGQRRSGRGYSSINLTRQKRSRSHSRGLRIVRRERSQTPTRASQIRGHENARRPYVEPKASSSQALMRWERPGPYQLRREGPPANRVQRCPVAPPSDLIINIATPSPDETAINDVYYLPATLRKHRSSISRGGTTSRASSEANSNRRRNDDTPRHGELSGNDEGPKAPALNVVEVDEAEPYVPPVFLWPVGRPSEARKTSSRSSIESHDHSDEKRPNTNAHPPSKPTDFDGVAPDIAKRVAQTLKAILESVDKELSSDKEYNMSLLNANEPTQGKLYRLIKPVSRKETAAKMVEIAGTREASDEPQSQKDVITWQIRLSELDQYLTEMFEFFLPAAYPDKVSEKYFGAVMYLLKVIFL
jgi:hypothetical protein